MTRAEYDGALSNLQRRWRIFLRRGIFVFPPATMLCLAWMLWYFRPIGLARRQHDSVIHRYPLPGYPVPAAQPIPSRGEMLTNLGAAMAIYTIVVGSYVCFGWRIVATTAPKCGHCGKILTFGTRKQVLADGHCPRCQQPLF